MWICVYCSSSSAVDGVYVQAAQRLGEEIAARGHGLIYGGSSVGLMGTVARAVHAGGEKVIGIIPEAMARRDIAYTNADELVLTDSMAERKLGMIARADAFVALPGGFGTLEELLELLTLQQLGSAKGNIVILNTAGFYDLLLQHFERLYSQRFAKSDFRSLYSVSEDVVDALDWLESHDAGALPSKWF